MVVIQLVELQINTFFSLSLTTTTTTKTTTTATTAAKAATATAATAATITKSLSVKHLWRIPFYSVYTCECYTIHPISATKKPSTQSKWDV